jgi:ATP-dependent RNA helicase DOB1
LFVKVIDTVVAELTQKEAEKMSMIIPDEDNIASYYELRQQLETYSKDMRDVINHPAHCLPFLQPGRVVRIKHEDMDFGWSVVVNYQKQIKKGKNADGTDKEPKYIVDCLMHCLAGSVVAKNADGSTVGIRPPKQGEPGEMIVSS